MKASIRFAVLQRDQYTCVYCGESAPNVILQVDHIHPVSQGGEDEMDNLVTACRDCNGGKSDTVLGHLPRVVLCKETADEIRARAEMAEECLARIRDVRNAKKDLLDRLDKSWREIAGISAYSSRTISSYVLERAVASVPIDEIMLAMHAASEEVPYGDFKKTTAAEGRLRRLIAYYEALTDETEDDQ